MAIIESGQTWLVLLAMIMTVAVGVWAEGKYKWASKISALVIILLLSIILSNVGLIPTEAPVYDMVWDYLLPLALPLLLFKSNIKKILRESGQMLIAFLIGAAGTTVGAFVSYGIFKNVINEIKGLAAMMTGTYIGGSVNFAVLGSAFGVSAKSVSAATIADNLNMAIFFLVLLAIPVKENVIRSEGAVADSSEETGKSPEISAKTIAIGLALSALIIVVSKVAADLLSQAIPASNAIGALLASFFGNQYLWITTLSVIVATVFADKVESLYGLQEIGVLFIYCFIFVIGAPASIVEIVKNSPLMLLFALVIVFFNMLFTFGFGALLKLDRKMLIIASNANIGGPTTAASMAMAKGWEELTGPAILVGCFGYVIGNYMGLLVGNML